MTRRLLPRPLAAAYQVAYQWFEQSLLRVLADRPTKPQDEVRVTCMRRHSTAMVRRRPSPVAPSNAYALTLAGWFSGACAPADGEARGDKAPTTGGEIQWRLAEPCGFTGALDNPQDNRGGLGSFSSSCAGSSSSRATTGEGIGGGRRVLAVSSMPEELSLRRAAERGDLRPSRRSRAEAEWVESDTWRDRARGEPPSAARGRAGSPSNGIFDQSAHGDIAERAKQ